MSLKHFCQRHFSRVRAGQAMVEYALILVMVAVLFAVTLAATGPAIGNVFSNTVYNLIGGKPEDVERLNDPGGRGESANFWATVEWVAANPPQEAAVPTNAALPPPATPTSGPSPTPTPVTPTVTPQPTGTVPASATPQDLRHIAPWLDEINNPGWWRIDDSVWVGSDEWYGEYFANTDLSGTPAWEEWNANIGLDMWNLDFSWSGSNGPRVGWVGDNFSVRWTRQLYVEGPDPVQVRFTTTSGSNGGMRLWLYPRDSGPTPAGGCSSVPSGGGSTGTANTYSDGQSPGGSPTDCLVIDNWRDDDWTLSTTRTLNPGFYVLQTDYYNSWGNAAGSVKIEGASSGHPDNANLAGGAPQCDWHQSGDSRSNSDAFMWEEARQGEFPSNMVCYLELRGWVDFSALAPSDNPQMVFWDVWDMASSNTEVWLEIAQYNPDPALRNWQRISLRQGTTNYNWTRNVIDLGSYISGFGAPELTFRFAMRDSGGGAPRRWYVDDIEIRNVRPQTFTVCTGDKATCGSFWDLDNPAAINGNPARADSPPDFLTTGRWALTSNRAQGVLSWDSGPVMRNWESGTVLSNFNEVRINALEFNGFIDLTSPVPDADGDQGAPILSFHQAYEIDNDTQLELQWTRDPYNVQADNWQTVAILQAESPSPVSKPSLTFTEIPLNTIPNWNTQPFRLRFAQLVEPDDAGGGGWWIDNLYIERLGVPRFSDYPFLDTAETGLDDWLPEGQWGVTADENFTRPICGGCGRAFTDSPGGDYLHNTNAALALRYPIDLNNNTPENIDPADTSNVQTAAAINPVLTFWHWRDLDRNDNFLVEWSNDQGVTWNTLWQYLYNSSNGRQYAWEYIEVDLRKIQANAVSNTDDDIIIRFRLDARNDSSTRDGLYIDDIRIQDYSETSHKLWDPDVNHPTYGRGDNHRFVDDFDTPADYENRWKLGGWDGTDCLQHSGLISLTESPAGSSCNPVNTVDWTYSVLGMNEIIDLRALSSSDNPTMYFWTRYDLDGGNEIRAEIATENTGYSPTDSNNVWNAGTNYERVRGWNDWQSRWSRPQDSINQAWHRAAVDLKPFAGQRIKVRFVFAQNGGSRDDGWYIDDVIIEQRSDIPEPLPFSDGAKSLGNWIVEGSWGLAPDQWRGSGGGPADIGNDFWTGVYYDCERHRSGDRCRNISQFNNLLYTNYAAGIERPYDPALDIQEFALEIDHDFGSNGRPVGGQNDPTWDDYYAGRWKRPITITTASDITFITISDDGVRLKYTGSGAPSGWNIIERWNYHGRRVDISTISFAPGNYELVLEWFEASGSAVIVLTAGINNFSFTDTPKAGNGPSFPVIESIEYSKSSMMLRRPIDLTGATLPVIQYWTRYDLGGDAGRFEVSTNGGFDWTQANLSSSTNGFSCPPGARCSPTITGNYWPSDPSDWQLRQHNLSDYIGNGLIHIRFQLDALTSWTDDGWYITDIEIVP